MYFNWLGSVRSRFGLPSMSRCRKQRHSHPLAQRSESLEARALLTPFYDLQVVASTSSGGTFISFGDLVSINNQTDPATPYTPPVGDVAFVGVTDQDGDDQRESGLWLAKAGYLPYNVNPSFSDNELRDFGRAVDLNNNGELSARDLYAPLVQALIRKWSSTTADARENIASANNFLQPDYGKWSGLQTFTDINDRGDVAFLTLTQDGKYRYLEVKLASASESRTVWAAPVGESTVPRPSLTADGRVLFRSDSQTLTIANPNGGPSESVVSGFTNIGYSAGISADGRLVSFIGDQGDGPGVYLAYRSGNSFKTVRVAGGGRDGWTEFDLLDAVRVNNTLDTERGVTVAFEAVHGELGRGIYTTRVSFVDEDNPNDFDLDFLRPVVHGAVPVVRVGESLPTGGRVTDVEFWNGLNDLDRGQLAFWVSTGSSQAVVRATPQQVVRLEFNPQGVVPAGQFQQNSQLLEEFGIAASSGMGWDNNFSAAMSSLGLSQMASSQAMTDIVNQVQSYFTEISARVRVVGGPGSPALEYVPWSTVTAQGTTVTAGVYQTVLIGGLSQTVATDGGEFGLASPVLSGIGGLDFFNQLVDDSAVVFANRILANGGVFTNASAAGYQNQLQALSSIIAHEIGHNFGLFHLEDDIPNTIDAIMRTTTPIDALLSSWIEFEDSDRLREQFYDDHGELLDLGFENSAARLRFATGATSNGGRHAPDSETLRVLEENLRANMPYRASGNGPSAARLLLGVRDPRNGDIMPAFTDLGTGSITELLSRAKIQYAPGIEVILLGSTDGTRLDIVGVPRGDVLDLATVSFTALGISVDSRLSAMIDPDATDVGFDLFYRPESGEPVLMGNVEIAPAPDLRATSSGAVLESAGTFSLGATTLVDGPLVRFVTIENLGAGPLELGTVAISGAGFSLIPPVSLQLQPGQSTTLTVTLSNAVGGQFSGLLTIPSNDPDGNLVLTLRGLVDDRPQVQAVTRIDNGTGPLRIAIDFSGTLQSGPASNPDLFFVSGVNGESVALASAVYTQTGATSRIVLTSVESSADLRAGQYAVRFDGSRVVSSVGAPLSNSELRLITTLPLGASTSIIGSGSDGLELMQGPDPTGFAAPKSVAVADFNGDGIQDIVATSQSTGELVLHWGQGDGTYGSPGYLRLEPASELTPAEPRTVETVDWNADGKPDLAVFDYAYGDMVYARVLVYLNDGLGNFSLIPDGPITVDNDYSTSILGIGDFTGDGKIDIAMRGAPMQGGQGTIAIYGKDPFLGYSVVAFHGTGGIEWDANQGVAADFNGDGYLDLALALDSGLYVRTVPMVFLGSASGLGAAQPLYYDNFYGAGTPRITAGDFTGDGHLDLAFVVDIFSNFEDLNDGGVVVVMAGDGAGHFSQVEYQVLNRRNLSLIGSSDLNGDGHFDLLLLANPAGAGQYEFDVTAERSFWTLTGDGTGAFTKSEELVPLAPSGSGGDDGFRANGDYVLADVTNDGLLDIVFGNGIGGQIGLVTNDGTGNMQSTTAGGPRTPTRSTFYSFVQDESAFAIADFNRDGYLDRAQIVKNNDDPSGVDLYFGNAAGGFTFEISVSIPVGSSPLGFRFLDPDWIRAGDLDNNGLPDLVLGDADAGGMCVLINVDGSTFTPSATYIIGVADSSYRVKSGTLSDVNQDGNLDLVTMQGTYNGVDGFPPSSFAVLFGDGNGRLIYNGNTLFQAAGIGPSVPLVQDVTGDGIPDIVAARNGSGLNALSIYAGTGNGRFTLKSTIDRTALNDGSQRVIAADFNADGKVDLLSIDWLGAMYFYHGNGSGQFTYAPEFNLNLQRHVGNLVTGDFNGDGHTDLALTSYARRTDQYVSTIFFAPGDGTGQYGPFEGIEAGGTDPRSLAVIPVAGTIEAGTFQLTLPPLNIPSGAIDLTAQTVQNQTILINPRTLLGTLTTRPLVLAITGNPAHGTVSLNPNGSLADLTDDLFVYTPDFDYSGTDQFTYLVADGLGGTATGTVTITITAKAGAAPVVTVNSSSLTYTENDGAVVVAPQATVSDADSLHFAGGRLIVSIAAGASPDDRLIIRSQGAPGVSVNGENVLLNGNVIGTWSGGDNGSALTVLFTTANATPLAVESLIRNIMYTNDSDALVTANRSLQFVVVDAAGGSSSQPVTRVISVNAVNDAPTLTPGGGQVAYETADSTIVIDPQMQFSDIDTSTFSGATLTIGFQSTLQTGDILAIRNEGAGANEINLNGTAVRRGTTVIGAYSGGFSSNSTLTITFNSNATAAAVQSVARNITFRIDEDSPSAIDRVVRFQATDVAGGSSTAVTRTIEVDLPNANTVPSIQLPGSNPLYSKSAVPINVAADAIVIDPDTGAGKLGGGLLAVSINIVNTGKFQRDVLDLSALNVIGTVSSTATVNGRRVTLIDLDADATANQIQNALRSIKFSTSKAGLKFATRSLQIQLSDASGAASNVVTKSINVSKKRVRVPRGQ